VEISISFINDEIKELYNNSGVMTEKSAGFDLVSAEDLVFSKEDRFKIINLGVILKIPEGHHTLLLPRSSTFKKYSIIQANSIGIIDQDYCGENDILGFPALYLGNDSQEIKN